jgi:PAS domain S-box-containing protein
MNLPDRTDPPDESENERLRLFIAEINDYAIYMLSPDGYVKSWNAGAQRFKGYREEEIIGEHFSRFYTPEDRAAGLPAKALQTALDEGKFEAEGWRMRKDGTRFWASVVIDPIRDKTGRLVAFAKITRDIEDRYRTQAELLASEEKFRLLVQGVTDYAIYMLSPTGDITNWNSGAERIKGYSENEVIGSHFSRFYTEEDRARGLPGRALATASEAGRFEGEGLRVRKDGTRFWAHVVIDRILSPAGELVGFAKITRDITERREAALALERAKESLFQAQKLDAIGKLTGGVAHDFNNLLSVIVNGLEVISRDVKGSSSARTVQSMLRAASRGATLTQQLLSFARQQPLRQDRYNLNSLINEFKTLLRRARDESVAVELDLQPDLKPVMIDAVQFEAALLNLISNANDAMPHGGRLVVSTANLSLSDGQVGSLPAGPYVKVTVADTGEGMSPEVAARAVEPFFTTKEIGKGTGMGLSQVFGLVQQCGGDLVVQSEPGKGTAIQLYLPALGDEKPLASPDAAAFHEKVLVVDDQPEVLETAAELFRIMGFKVLCASDGNQALEMLKQNLDTEVLFSDVVMPGINGMTLAREARQLIPDINVILVSGYSPESLEITAEDREGFHLLSKPFRMAEVARALRNSATVRRG